MLNYTKIALDNDLDDFYLWFSFKNREKNIEKYFMNKDMGKDNNLKQKVTFSDPQKAAAYFMNRQ